jgi:hypothetical protein
VTVPEGINLIPRVAVPHEVAVVYASDTFTFEAGSRMRTAKCLACDQAIGGDPVAVIGVAALDGAPCACGATMSDVYLMHTDHMPLNMATLHAAITRGVECDLYHSSH